MKKVLFFAAALTLVASAAFAAGIDLSLNACPGNATALGIDGGAIDCAGGQFITVLGTWAPAEALSDLVALDNILDCQVAGDMDANGFWNFDVFGCNPGALNSSHQRPATGCSTPVAYTATWSVASSGSSIAASRNAPSTERLGISVYRPSVLSVAANQKLFGFQMTIDASTSSESGGGSCNGCTQGFCVVWNSGQPGSVAGTPTQLNSSTGNFAGISNLMSFNSGGGLCGAVPTKQRTWGQLKSLYR